MRIFKEKNMLHPYIIHGFYLFYIYILILILVISWVYIDDYFNLKDENVVEEIIENIIERNTNINLDLTPDSPEENKQHDA